MTRTVKKCEQCHRFNLFCEYPRIKKYYDIPTEDLEQALKIDTPILLRFLYGIPAQSWQKLVFDRIQPYRLNRFVTNRFVRVTTKEITRIGLVHLLGERQLDTCKYRGRCKCCLKWDLPLPFFATKLPELMRIPNKSRNKQKGLKKQYNKY